MPSLLPSASLRSFWPPGNGSAEQWPSTLTCADVPLHRRRNGDASKTGLNMHRLHTKRLMDEVAVRAEQSIPQLDPIDVDPAAAARIVRMQWRMPVGAVHGLVRWMEAAGCIIIEEDFGTTRVDGMSQWIEDYPVLLINDRLPVDRKRSPWPMSSDTWSCTQQTSRTPLRRTPTSLRPSFSCQRR